MVALQALAEYAALTSGNNDRQNLVIQVTAGTLTYSFTITALNALVLQSVQVLLLTHTCMFIAFHSSIRIIV